MIDITIVAAYLLLLLYIGAQSRGKQNSFKDFASMGEQKKTSKFLLVASIFATSIGGGTTFGISEKVFNSNLAHSYGLFLAILVDIAIAYSVVPRLVRFHGAETTGDIMANFYGPAGRFITGIASIFVSLGLLAAQISVSGRIFEYILNIDYAIGVIISYTIIIIYSTMGGLRSVLFAGQLQFIAMLFAVPVISIVGIYNIGVDNFIQHLPYQKIVPTADNNLVALTISAFLGFTVMNLFPTFIQRAMINQDTKATQQAIYIKSSIFAFFLILISVNGIIAYMLYPGVSGRLALPILIDQIIPIGLQGLVISGLLAAVMSTADSDLNITAISMVKDVIGTFKANIPQNKMLSLAKFFNVAIGGFAILLALSFSSVIDLVIFISGFWGPIILPSLIAGLYGIKISNKIFITSAIVGATSFIGWQVFFTSSGYILKAVFVGTFLNSLVILANYTFGKVRKTKVS